MHTRKNATNISKITVSELVSEAVNWCMKMWKNGEPYQTTPDKYSIDLIFGCLNAGAVKSVTIGGKVGASPDLGTACTMPAPVRPAPNRSKTARWWGVPPNGFEKLRSGVVVAAWWRGCEKNCTGRGVGRHGAARAAPT